MYVQLQALAGELAAGAHGIAAGAHGLAAGSACVWGGGCRSFFTASAVASLGFFFARATGY
jgi:hypothetical protein